MKVFECKVCGHIEFDAAPETCLVCRSKAEAFVEKPDAIKKPANPAELSEGDRKHIPQIVVVKECGLLPGTGCTDVHVKVGAITHVMEDKHYIRYIDYYLDRKFISRVWLSPNACFTSLWQSSNVPSTRNARTLSPNAPRWCAWRGDTRPSGYSTTTRTPGLR